jgi:hypothetical protein
MSFVDTNRRATSDAGPFRFLFPQKFLQTLRLNGPQIGDHAHAVVFAIPLIQSGKALAGEFVTGIAEVLPDPLPAGFDLAGRASFGFPPIIAPAPGATVPFPHEGPTEAAIHSARCDEHCFVDLGLIGACWPHFIVWGHPPRKGWNRLEVCCLSSGCEGRFCGQRGEMTLLLSL